ncbi:unnamed protein product [Ascophyllum nodosum]
MGDFIVAAKGGVTSIPPGKWALTLKRFSAEHEATWALIPLYGIDNKLAMARVVVQLLNQTVGVNGKQRSPCLGLDVEAEALLAARILLREREGAEALMDDKALELFVHAAKEEGDAACGYRVSLMALKCINNAIWDQPSGQLVFVRLGGMDMLVTLMQVCRPGSVLYFASRIFNVVGTSNSRSFAKVKMEHDLLQPLLTVLVWCVRCTDPPFPEGEDRLKLMVQVLQGIFLLGARLTTEEKNKALTGDKRKWLGYLLVDILHLDHQHLDTFMAKLQALNLLLDMPSSFAEVLIAHGCLPRILQVIELQLVRQDYREGGDIDAAAELTPALLVLNKLVLASEESRTAVKAAIFPPEADEVWREQLAREQEEVMCLSGDGRRQVDKASTTKDTTGRRVHPVDAPRGSLRARLFKQMTATEGSSKAAVSDLIFNLCEDEEEFTIRCGFGNAINTLRLKGKISMAGM